MDNAKLKINKFEVNMIYGFATEPMNKEKEHEALVDKKLENRNNFLRNGWSTFYNLDLSHNGLTQDIPLEFNQKKEEKDELGFEISEGDEKKWPTSYHKFEGKVSRKISYRKDGIGTLTLNFNFDNHDSKDAFSVGDVLRTLLLVPRTLYGDKNEKTEITDPDKITPMPTSDNLRNIDEDTWSKYSFPYKLYLNSLLELKEPFKPWKGKVADKTKTQPEFFFGTYEESFVTYEESLCNYEESLCNNTDSQTPSMFVKATIPYETYMEDFKNNKEKRRAYFREIASILGRWLNEHNIDYISEDYWKEEQVLESKFMNSLVFTTFSGMVTISIVPDLQGANMELEKRPIEITKETILRYLEISRMRWHESILINQDLDILVKKIAESYSSLELKELYNRLIIIEKRIASHLENPSYYLWDASLGSNLVSFIEEEIINKIEDELNKKLTVTRNLIKDKIDIITIDELIDNY